MRQYAQIATVLCMTALFTGCAAQHRESSANQTTIVLAAPTIEGNTPAEAFDALDSDEQWDTCYAFYGEALERTETIADFTLNGDVIGDYNEVENFLFEKCKEDEFDF